MIIHLPSWLTYAGSLTILSLLLQQSLTRYSVVGHPLLLDMLDIHAIPLHHHHGHLITLIERNQFQQQVGIYSLQLQTKYDKVCLW